jgi:3-hydroxyacyl-CoA dehydrogenase, NAD binding domain
MAASTSLQRLRQVRKVGAVGAGTMGGGIAMNFVNAGIATVVVEVSDNALQRGLATVRRSGSGCRMRCTGTRRSTNPIENLNGSIAIHAQRQAVARRHDGAARWVASALSDAATRMRKLRGRAQVKTLLAALAEHDLDTLERSKRKAA